MDSGAVPSALELLEATGAVGVVTVWPATAAASARITNVCSAAAHLEAGDTHNFSP